VSSCVPNVRIAEIHPQGRYIKLRNTSETQVIASLSAFSVRRCSTFMRHCSHRTPYSVYRDRWQDPLSKVKFHFLRTRS